MMSRMNGKKGKKHISVSYWPYILAFIANVPLTKIFTNVHHVFFKRLKRLVVPVTKQIPF